MNLSRHLSHFRKLAKETTISCALFSFMNSLCSRLRFKSQLGIPVNFRRNGVASFCMRLGTTDFETFTVTFLRDEYSFVSKHIPTLKTIIDLGANIGDSGRYFADAYPDARIVAIEPDPGNYAVCVKNLHRIGHPGRMFCKQCFVGDKPGQAGLERSEGEWAFKMDRTSTAGEQVPVVTMLDLMSELKLGEVDLLKCDIEGAEEELFRNCSSWISQIRHLAIETCPPYSVAMLERDIAASGTQFEKLHHTAPDGYHELALFRRAGGTAVEPPAAE